MNADTLFWILQLPNRTNISLTELTESAEGK